MINHNLTNNVNCHNKSDDDWNGGDEGDNVSSPPGTRRFAWIKKSRLQKIARPADYAGGMHRRQVGRGCRGNPPNAQAKRNQQRQQLLTSGCMLQPTAANMGPTTAISEQRPDPPS